MTEAEPTTGPEPTVTEYNAQLRELEAKYPPPTWEEVREEWKWLHEGMANGTFDPEYKYGGLAVAIYDKRVVGTDVHWLRQAFFEAKGSGARAVMIVRTSAAVQAAFRLVRPAV